MNESVRLRSGLLAKLEHYRDGAPLWCLIVVGASWMFGLGILVLLSVMMVRDLTRKVERTVVDADLSSLIDEWGRNPVAVKDRYHGQVVRTRGILERVDANLRHEVYLVLATKKGRLPGQPYAHVFVADEALVWRLKEYPFGSEVTVSIRLDQPPGGNLKANLVAIE